MEGWVRAALEEGGAAVLRVKGGGGGGSHRTQRNTGTKKGGSDTRTRSGADLDFS